MDGEPHLAGTARPPVARLSPTVARALGLRRRRSGRPCAARASAITLPLAVTGMVDGAVWLPAHIDGIATTGRLGVLVGDPVAIEPAGPAGFGPADTGTAGRER